MTHVTLFVIGLLIYWPVAVFIGHAEKQRRFEPTTEAVVCHSLHPWPKPGGVWDICEIPLDQRMTITPAGIRIPPTAAFEGWRPLSSGQLRKHRCSEAHTHVNIASAFCACGHFFSYFWTKCAKKNLKVIKYSESSGLCCPAASVWGGCLCFLCNFFIGKWPRSRRRKARSVMWLWHVAVHQWIWYKSS